MFQCKHCHAGRFCSKECQKSCWQDHKVLCEIIVKLESQLKARMFSKLNYISRSSLTPKEEIKLVKLVGRKCVVNCCLEGKETKVLWDTGAEVALISRTWLDENFPEKPIKDVSELLGHELFLKVANNCSWSFLFMKLEAHAN